MILVSLFISFVIIGAFSFGGGYAALPLIQNQIVSLHHWLSPDEFNHLITISQMTPGPIAINSATFVGLKIDGIAGAVTATLGCVLPSCILGTLLARIYLKYRSMSLLQGILATLRPAVIAMIAAAGVSILVTAFWSTGIMTDSVAAFLSHTDWQLVGIFILSLVLLRKFKMNPIHVMLLSGVAEVILQAVFIQI